MSNTFWLTAALGGATISTMVLSNRIDELVSDWERVIKMIEPDADVRDETREFIIGALLKNKHHTDQEVASRVCQALLWFVVKGPAGEKILPFLRRGGANVKVHQEITKVGSEGPYPAYNLRTIVDEETSAQLSL